VALRCNARRARCTPTITQEAKRLGHNYIGTEMVLMGLLLETEGMAAQVLRDLAGLQTDATRQKLELLIGRGDGRVLEAVDIPFTHHTSQLLQQALVEAQELGASLTSRTVWAWLNAGFDRIVGFGGGAERAGRVASRNTHTHTHTHKPPILWVPRAARREQEPRCPIASEPKNSNSITKIQGHKPNPTIYQRERC
jgi:ATP-dependent Clp protease ATP-binding subunit ClpC